MWNRNLVAYLTIAAVFIVILNKTESSRLFYYATACYVK